MTKQIPGLRILVEGVVIVLSILLAFGIDAWWDDVQQQAAEQEALRGLETDFAANLEALKSSIAAHIEYRRNLAALEEMTDLQLAAVPPDSVGIYVRAMGGPHDVCCSRWHTRSTHRLGEPRPDHRLPHAG